MFWYIESVEDTFTMWGLQQSKHFNIAPGIPQFPDIPKMLLNLEFLFDHSEVFTKQTRHRELPCSNGGISQLHKFWIPLKCYSSLNSYKIILICLPEKLGPSMIKLIQLLKYSDDVKIGKRISMFIQKCI